MPRKRKLLTNRTSIDMRSYQLAYEEVLRGKAVRHVAKMFGLNYVSLTRYKRKREQALAGTPIEHVTMGYSSAAKVFSIAQEIELVNYAMKSAEIYFGLSKNDLRKMAYDLTLKYNLARPSSWDFNGIAGIEWCISFLARHKQLSATSAQASMVKREKSNKQNFDQFYDNLEKLLEKHKFEPQDIYIVDETGIMAEQIPNRVLAKKGTRQLGALTSAQRETLVTVTLAANAIGNVIAPMFTFATANEPGWIQEEDLLAFLQHFQSQTKCSLDHQVLLLIDNHASHVSIKCIDYCIANSIVVLSFPPHCSHNLQPLACAVYGPFKQAVNTACDGWMKSNPGTPITIYDIPRIVTEALPQAVPEINVQAGFRCTGIYPFRREIFSGVDLASSNSIEIVLVGESNIKLNKLSERKLK